MSVHRFTTVSVEQQHIFVYAWPKTYDFWIFRLDDWLFCTNWTKNEEAVWKIEDRHFNCNTKKIIIISDRLMEKILEIQLNASQLTVLT